MPLPRITPVPPQPQSQQSPLPTAFTSLSAAVVSFQRLRRISPLLAAQATFDFAGLPPADVYHIRYFGRTTAAGAQNVQLRLNGNSGGNYFSNQLDASNAGAFAEQLGATQGNCGSVPTTASTNTGCGTIDIFGGNQSALKPIYTYQSYRADGGGAGQTHTQTGGGLFGVLGIVTEITLLLGGGNWDVGSWAAVWGELAG